MKFLFKGVLNVTDMILIVLDAFDCDIKKSKITKIIKKFSKDKNKEIIIVLNKCDMFDN